MKEAYAVRRTVPPSAEIQASIEYLLGKGMVDDPQRMLSELARLGARLIIHRAVEEEFDSWLGRARYERRPEQQRGLRPLDGPNNGLLTPGHWASRVRHRHHLGMVDDLIDFRAADSAPTRDWTAERDQF
jgi:hypothetical protein